MHISQVQYIAARPRSCTILSVLQQATSSPQPHTSRILRGHTWRPHTLFLLQPLYAYTDISSPTACTYQVQHKHHISNMCPPQSRTCKRWLTHPNTQHAPYLRHICYRRDKQTRTAMVRIKRDTHTPLARVRSQVLQGYTMNSIKMPNEESTYERLTQCIS